MDSVSETWNRRDLLPYTTVAVQWKHGRVVVRCDIVKSRQSVQQMYSDAVGSKVRL